MNSYIESVKAEFKSGKTALLVILFTLVRVIYGYGWFTAGLHKLAWLSDGKLNSAGLIGKMINNVAGPEVTKFDPLYINKFFGWVADTIFLGMPGVTDTLVVIFEIGVGLFMILGFKVFWTALLALFMNTQFFAAGSFNNFGYVWTNIALMQFAKYAEVLGVDGFLKARKGKSLTGAQQTAK